MAAVGLGLAWSTNQRLKSLEPQLVARQQQAQTESTQALVLSRQSQDATRDMNARMALLEARLSEATVQRTQLDELIQSLSRSRDENLLADLEAALRVAQQQSALTGSLEPLVSTLRQADERLARYNQPRLERVRRAVLRDLDRVRAVSQIDVPTLVIRLDEVVRQVDDLPLMGVSQASSAAQATAQDSAASTAPANATAAPPATTTAPGLPDPAGVSRPSAPTPNSAPAASTHWWASWTQQAGALALQALSTGVDELRRLVRITRIDHPEAVLAAPDQLFYLRENLKLRLLNARLALLSRQFDVAQSDLRDAQRTLERYFDPGSRRVAVALELMRQVSQQSRQVTLPRPDETLAALASVNPLGISAR